MKQAERRYQLKGKHKLLTNFGMFIFISASLSTLVLSHFAVVCQFSGL